MESKILLVGCGKMGAALLPGWQSAGFGVHVAETDAGRRRQAEAQGAAGHASLEALPQGFAPDAIVVAVEPAAVAGVLQGCRRWSASEAVLISVAAGVRLADMAGCLPDDARLALVRAMPNIPATIGAGMVVACAAAGVGAAARRLAARVLEGAGAFAWVEDEALMDAVTAVSGSGPGYVFAFIEALAQAGAAAGLPPELAMRLAVETVAGAGRMAKESGVEAAELRRSVSTPGGTTEAALKVLRGGEGRLQALLQESVAAARRRAGEIGRSG